MHRTDVGTTSTGPPPGHPHGSVVVGVDGSPGSDHALSWAAEQAALEHRTLVLVHDTIADGQVWIGSALGRATAPRRHLDGSTQRTLLDAATRATAEQPGLAVRRLSRSGGPVPEVLLDAARGASMLVVGSRGLGAVRSLILGSVGAAVSGRATCPVVVVRPRTTGRPSHGVVVGVGPPDERLGADDLHEPDDLHPAVAVAFALASTRGWPLTVLQCVPPVEDDDWDDWPEWDPAQASSSQRLVVPRSRLAAAVLDLAAAHPETEVQTMVEHGFLDKLLVRFSADADAVVLGAEPPTRLRHLIRGASTDSVVEHAQGVVVVVPGLSPR